MKSRSSVLCLLSLLTSAVTFPAQALPPAAVTRSGEVSGADLGGVRVFRGIPYAAPPVGPLRWRAPRPPAPWHGVRDATVFGPSCMQNPDPRLGVDTNRLSEDCLSVNVWTPARTATTRLPVMVVIPGGGFFGGGSSIAPTDGLSLAKHGIVVVSFNYRLGVFGFLAHPALSKEAPSGASGAYGLLDQVAALKWVRDNIGAFGGDAAKVTIMGESAGGSSVLYLLVSPMAKGLFRAAIAESPGRVWIPPQHLKVAAHGLQSAEDEGAALGSDLDGLRAVPAVEMQERSDLRADVFCDERGVDFWPIVDGEVLRDDPARLFAAGKAAHVPLLVGTNADEGSLFALDCKASVPTPARWREFLGRKYPAVADRLRAQYPAPNDADVQSAEAHWITDWGFAGSARAAARLMKAPDQPAYLYKFTRRNAKIIPLPDVGSFHSMEVPYVFGNLGAPPNGSDPYDATDRALSRSMQLAWVRFVRTGSPNGPGLPRWPRFDGKPGQVMDFGDKPIARRIPTDPGLDTFDGAIKALEGAP